MTDKEIIIKLVELELDREDIEAQMAQLREAIIQSQEDVGTEPDEEEIEDDDPPFLGDEEEEEPEPDLDAASIAPSILGGFRQ